MDYLLGSLVTLTLIFIGKKLIEDKKPRLNKNVITHSQSYIYSIIGPIIRVLGLTKKLDTQLSKYEDSLYIKVIIAEDKAYWISNNTFYVADQEDGFIDKETTRPVDTMAMDRVQLDKMMFIVETLTEGADDEDRNSGNKEL